MKEKLQNILESLKKPQSILGEGVTTKVASTKKALIVFFVILLTIWLNIGSLAEILVSEESIKQGLEETLSEKLNAEVTINGEVSFSSKPEPNVIIQDIIIKRDGPDNIGEPLSRIKVLKGRTSLSSFFYGSHDLTEISIEDAEVNTFLSGGGNFLYFLRESGFGEIRSKINNIKITTYKRNPVGSSNYIKRVYEFLSFEIDPDPAEGDYIIKGSVKMNNSPDAHFFRVNLEDGLSSDTEYQVKFYSSDTEVDISGDLQISKELEFNGKISGYIGGFTGRLITKVFDEELVNQLKIKDRSEITGVYEYKNNRFKLRKANISGPVANYNIKLDAVIKQTIDLDINILLSELNFHSLFKSKEEYLASKTVVEVEQDFQKRLEKFFLFSLNDDINFELGLEVKKINFSNGQKGTFAMSSELKDKTFRIEDFKFLLPGGSSVKIASKIKINRQAKKLSGHLDLLTYGKNLGVLLESLRVNGNNKKDKSNVIKEFYLKTRGYIYEKKVHFREIIAQFNKNKLAGQLLIDYSNDFAASSAVTFNELEIDNYYDNRQKELSEEEADNIANKLDFIRVFDSLFDRMDLSISSKNITKSGILLEDFSMFTQVKPGVVDVKDVFFYTNQTGVFRGSARFDISEFQPKIDLDLRLERFDFDYLLYGAKNPQNDTFVPDGKWSNSSIDIQKLSTVLGKFNFEIDNFKLAHLDLTDLKTSMKMLGERVNIDPSRFEIYGSKVGFEGNFTTEYPSFNIKYEASELDFGRILVNLFGVSSISGKFNSSGILSSTGYTYSEMISKLKGRINLVSNGFVVEGFDFPSYTVGLSKIRRVEQVKIVSEELLNKGSTDFGYFGSAFIISAGKLIFNNIPLQSKYTKNVSTSGIIDFYNWKVKIGTEYTLVTADSYNVPLSSQVSGDITDREIEWDYSGAKKYWEEKFYGGKIF